jgi:hypothetical protein
VKRLEHMTSKVGYPFPKYPNRHWVRIYADTTQPPGAVMGEALEMINFGHIVSIKSHEGWYHMVCSHIQGLQYGLIETKEEYSTVEV